MRILELMIGIRNLDFVLPSFQRAREGVSEDVVRAEQLAHLPRSIPL